MYSFQKNNEKKPHKIQRHNKQILQKDIVKNFSALIPIYNDLSTTPDICVDFFCYANLNFNKIVQSQYLGYKFLQSLQLAKRYSILRTVTRQVNGYQYYRGGVFSPLICQPYDT